MLRKASFEGREFMQY